MIRALVVAAFVVAATAIGAAAPAAVASPYANCSEAKADGVYNIPRGDENYWDDGDRDGRYGTTPYLPNTP
jgi:hypothetical protein